MALVTRASDGKQVAMDYPTKGNKGNARAKFLAAITPTMADQRSKSKNKKKEVPSGGLTKGKSDAIARRLKGGKGNVNN